MIIFYFFLGLFQTNDLHNLNKPSQILFFHQMNETTCTNVNKPWQIKFSHKQNECEIHTNNAKKA